MASKRAKKKLSSGTKENITQVVDDLSMVIGRKSLPVENSRKILSAAFDHMDAYIAALGLVLPESDVLWKESGAREAFFSIKRKRKWMIRSLFAIAIFGNLVIIIVSILAIVFMTHWAKWIILGIAILLIFLGSFNVPQYIISPYITNYDHKLNEKFPKECNLINQYIKELLDIRSKKK
ncbi:MAG: hypothetical protein ACFFDW_06965 [Candidatus Thorarchaeota archaeon]